MSLIPSWFRVLLITKYPSASPSRISEFLGYKYRCNLFFYTDDDYECNET